LITHLNDNQVIWAVYYLANYLKIKNLLVGYQIPEMITGPPLVQIEGAGLKFDDELNSFNKKTN